MKKIFCVIYLLVFGISLLMVGCSCNDETTLNQEDATNVLKNTIVEDSVKVITTTEVVVNDIKSTSTQEELYSNDAYYHSSELNGLLTKTWYGYVNNNLYAFYYTKNSENTESKTSTRIDTTQLDAVKKQPHSLINNLFDEDDELLPNYTIKGYKNRSTYVIEISYFNENESNVYTFTIENDKLIKAINIHNATNGASTKITYTYEYNIGEISLPTIQDYPLHVSG